MSDVQNRAYRVCGFRPFIYLCCVAGMTLPLLATEGTDAAAPSSSPSRGLFRIGIDLRAGHSDGAKESNQEASTSAPPIQPPSLLELASLAQVGPVEPSAPAAAPTIETASVTSSAPPALPPELAGAASQAASAATGATPTPSQNVTVNLIRRLVKRGVLSPEDADDLIKQAEADAAVARAQAGNAGGNVAGGSEGAPAAEGDTVRVTYVPEVVKQQMREEIKQEVMTEAREENWAAPRTFPDWVSRFHFVGDVRTRYEGDFFPANNATGFGSSFWNFNGINTGSPFDITSLTTNPPFFNADQDRNRARLRARFGTEVDVGSGFTSGVRIGTGESSSPVSENQSLGASGGNFSKYAIWLDRGFIKYDVGGKPEKDLSATVGRFDNPFFSTSMIWADDLAFDGLSVKGKYRVADGVTPFLTTGAFPVYNTDLNFSSNQPTKFQSEDKWLYAVQVGSDFKPTDSFGIKVGAAFYDFENVQGKVSSPFVPLTSADAGNTDASRPSFAQRGNTYIALRNITPDPSNNNGAINQWQYFGLATPFRVAALTSQLDFYQFDPFHLWLVGEAVDNVAFNKGAINRNGPSNLRGPVNNNAPNGGGFEGGNLGGLVRLNLGKASLEKLWDWNVSIGYRYVESDAVIDGFCDSDFGGGGTNLKGYTVGGNIALSPHVSAGLRWMSADSIAGPTFNEDVIQFDINAKF